MAQAETFTFGIAALSRLMPLFLCLDAAGRITALGPTLAKLLPHNTLIGQKSGDLFDLKRPSRRADLAAIQAVASARLHLAFRSDPAITFRGLAMPLQGGGLMINLSFGIGVTEAVRRHGLTEADFAPTDLTVEMLYLAEAKSAVVGELRDLNLRLQGAKIAAEEQALTDTLTGLRNRRALDLALGELTRHGHTFGLMHIDLDFFKQVNDTLGHAAGDHVLRVVARILTAQTRSSDTVARVGGMSLWSSCPKCQTQPDLAKWRAGLSRILRNRFILKDNRVGSLPRSGRRFQPSIPVRRLIACSATQTMRFMPQSARAGGGRSSSRPRPTVCYQHDRRSADGRITPFRQTGLCKLCAAGSVRVQPRSLWHRLCPDQSMHKPVQSYG